MKDINKQPGIKFDTIFLVKELFSRISAITTKAGMQTIFLSPINVQALINSSK